jgi:hypothetical protein
MNRKGSMIDRIYPISTSQGIDYGAPAFNTSTNMDFGFSNCQKIRMCFSNPLIFRH